MLSLRIGGKRYTRKDVARSQYDRASGYIHMVFHDGTSARIDAAGILVA